MRTMKKVGVGLALAVTAGSFGWANEALAQSTDDNPPLPNVLLLVDTSGSMEYAIDGTLPTVTNDCTTMAPSPYSSRWHELLMVMTGNVPNGMRGCAAQSRIDPDFLSEYAFEGLNPYDEGYFLDYHRLISNDCVYTTSAPPAGYDPMDMMGWGATPVDLRSWTSGLPAMACGASGFVQQPDGIIDIYRDRVRFGLFTFDARPDEGTGATASGNSVDAATGIAGHWSYFEDWETGAGSPATGHPNDCDPMMTNTVFEVGARNPAAPPWEGKMVNHGPVFATLQETRDHNDRVQDVLLSLRPYGATPLAGMFDDARYFIRRDDMMDGYYHTPTFQDDERFAPAYDPLLNTTITTAGQPGTCRQQYIILLSDGEPNLDMRPHCEPAMGAMPPGDCPYDDRPHEVAADLLAGTTPNIMNAAGTPSVQTFVIGFGIGATLDGMGNPVDCDQINVPMNPAFDPGNVCTGATGALAACCALSEIAFEGGTTNAYFADDPVTLKLALSTILDSIITPPTSRTVPSFINVDVVDGGAGNVNAPAVSYEFASAFTPKPGELWRGNLERKRWTCPTMAPFNPSLEPVSQGDGDDFSFNLHNGGVGTRYFFTAIPDRSTPTTESQPTWSVRPNSTGLTDGVGTYGTSGLIGAATNPMEQIGAFPVTASTFPEAMGVDPMSPVPAACQGPYLTQPLHATCAQDLMRWYLGEAGVYNEDIDGDGLIDQPDRSQNMLGAVYHSSPRIIGPPAAVTADPSYAVFQKNDACSAECALTLLPGPCSACTSNGRLLEGPRPLVMYVSTTDGQLHAFKVAASDPSDLASVANDDNNEMWSFIPPFALPQIHTMFPATPVIALDGKIVVRDIPFERTVADASTLSTRYRTILVASGGLGGGYYFALDVTRPEQPEFLWQLSTDAAGAPIFGDQAGEPAIALVPFEEGMPAVKKEIAVAILPGGYGDPAAANPGCMRKVGDDHIDVSTNPKYTPRGTIRCFDEGPANSVTIVRLETGEVLRQFRRDAANSGPTSLQTAGVAVAADLDEPILGAVTFPNATGQVSTRAYLTGQDGSIYRIGFSDTDPANWTFDLMFDAYPLPSDDHTTSHPVAVLPTVSVDERGNPVLVFSTGDQEEFRNTTNDYRVWSIREVPVVGMTSREFEVESNWYLSNNATAVSSPGIAPNQYGMDDGEKVTGPIATFGGISYFSTNTPAPAGSECLVGTSRVWGVSTLDLGNDKIPDPGISTTPVLFKIVLPQGENPFGVAVGAEPSCREDLERIDNYVGRHNVATQNSRPNYVIRLFTGREGTDTDPNSSVNARTIDVREPESTVLIDSWAGIVE